MEFFMVFGSLQCTSEVTPKNTKGIPPVGRVEEIPSKSPKKIFPKISYDFFTFYNALSH